MPSRVSKSYFAMAQGLNTEAPLINFPDGFTTEEQNYELTVRGERRRRLGLALETGGNTLDLTDTGYEAGYPIKVFDWENVANLSNVNYIVMQVGWTLWIFDDVNPISPTLKVITVDFRPYSVTNATDAQIASSPLQSATGRGSIFFFGKYTNPFTIAFDNETGLFSISQINIMERDFVDVPDGYSMSDHPVVAVNSHVYNLRNRGWPQAYIDSYVADEGNYPSKAMIPWLGLRRALTGTSSYDNDGIRSFGSSKLVTELFQDATAPLGHFIKSPFESQSTPDTNASLPIESWSISGTTPGFQTMTVEVTGHGLATLDTVTMTGTIGTYNTDPGLPITPEFSVFGNYLVTNVVDPDNFQIQVTFPYAWPFVSWKNQFYTLGSIVGGALPIPTGDVTDFRPRAGAFFAGRLWFAGTDSPKLGGRVYFSQIVEADAQYGKCYQVADPCDERISDLAPSDGGVIVIPEAANVQKLVPLQSSLVVYAANGVWEVGPGDRGYFAADNYSVRKLTDNGAASEGSVVVMDFNHVYFGITDIYAVAPNPKTGFLEVTNISNQTISTYYNDIPLASRRISEGIYDDQSRRVIWLYSTSEDNEDYTYDAALIFDERLGAFTVFKFAHSPTAYVGGIFILKEAGAVAKVKYVGVNGLTLTIGETNSTTYNDFGIGEPECYMITAYDSLRDPGTFKMAPEVIVYSRKTEEGYTLPDYEPIRPSSTQMRSRWDWADNASASKWGRYQEVYRHRRTYLPTGPSDTYDDGVPLVVSNNKVRGIGRVLQLEFRAGTGKDSWIQGWKTNFVRYE